MKRLSCLLSSLMLFGCAVTPQDHGGPQTLRIDIQGDQGTVNPHIYGHFAEHLGRGIYDGFWYKDEQGEYSARADIIEALQAIQIPNLRWPGGCFADDYDWKDGIGPTDERPTVVNNNWGGVTEDNNFGTHEFMELVRLLGTEPIVVGNVGSGTVQDMAQWWEYMNHPGMSPMATLREENGQAAPWNVTYWGVGNESWGCGGNMRPEYYADLYRRFATYLRPYGDHTPFRIAAGAAGNDYEWTEVLMREAGDMMDGLDLHHYTIVGSWETHKGEAVNFPEEEWFELMHRAQEIDELLTEHKAIMDKYDPEKRVWLIVGEWGTWHEVEEGTPPGFLYHQNTIRDALTAAVTLDFFHQHLDRVKMANIAQTVNVLQAMILTQGEEMILTPTYHVFEFHNVHHGATALPIELDAGQYVYGDRSVPAVSASATRNDADDVNITLTNVDLDRERTIEIDIPGKAEAQVSGRILTAEAMNAHNTFDEPNAVSPQAFDAVESKDGKWVVTLPPKSLVLLTLR